jgi:hypothetical protein
MKELLIYDVASKVEALTKRKFKLISIKQELVSPFYVSHNLYIGMCYNNSKIPRMPLLPNATTATLCRCPYRLTLKPTGSQERKYHAVCAIEQRELYESYVMNL